MIDFSSCHMYCIDVDKDCIFLYMDCDSYDQSDILNDHVNTPYYCFNTSYYCFNTSYYCVNIS